ncbi:putative choloylglycine hydrolase [Salsuginibacillus halophilus]|uniref:Putative choloylglycine hydrolase n=1 Tax=Salsuginibacillus halophilus TaxID=517424 RepID=A0A2P8HWK7_9BACI|nr:C45 family peptidase [Salsuginibacillus halophilus]PSL50613.1 putative choloylglycine hydrolase [Salsuginibacillus halophilus]
MTDDVQELFLPILYYSGSYQEIGYEQGRALINTPLIENHTRRLKRSKKRFAAPVNEVKNLYDHFCPGLFQELKGLADGLNWPIDDVIHEYSGFQGTRVKAGCTAAAAAGVYARNYDYQPQSYEGRLVITLPENGLAVFGISQRLIGRTDGMNEAGLALGYHFVNRVKPAEGIVCSNICRIVLETCHTVAEAAALLQKLPHRHAFSYSMADALGRTAVVEGSPRGVAVFEGTSQVCANRFRAPRLQRENRKVVSDSIRREDLAEQALKNEISAEHLYKSFNETKQHKQEQISAVDYSQWNGTLHTAVYDTNTLTVKLGFGVNRRPVELPLKDLFRGWQTPIKQIRASWKTSLALPFHQKLTEPK